MSLNFVPFGVGDAFSRKYYSTCLGVTAEGRSILVDCPHPIRKMISESVKPSAISDLGDIDAVVLTHLHADHASGLEGYLFFSRFHLNRKGTIAAHADVLKQLWDGHLAAGMDQIKVDGEFRKMSLADYADTIPLDETSPTQIGPFRIECRRTKHHIPTFALKIHAGGASLGYSADTKFDPALIEWLSGADLVIHETNEGIHTPYEKLATLPEALRQKMRLVHYPDDFDAGASVIELMEQGRVYRIG
jgi:ribonuclease BN (tRNA processing enzyme)